MAAWVGSHAYSVGDLVKPTAPAAGKEYVFRVTTAGTSTTEPSWPTANNSTVTAGATFTNVTGQSTYGWSAAAGTLYCMANINRTSVFVVGDRIFISSDSSENQASGNITYGLAGNGYGLLQVISVNRAGSVPPVAADLQSGAAIACAGTGLAIDHVTDMFWQGVTFTMSGASGNISLASVNSKSGYYKNCAFVLSGAANSVGKILTGISPKIVWDNTTVQFAHIGQSIGGSASGTFLDLTWINTPSAIAGSTLPTALFTTAAGGAGIAITGRGIDLSAITGTLLAGSGSGWQAKVLLDSCRIASGVARYTANGAAAAGVAEEVELVNCYDGSNVLNERYTAAGTLTTDRTTYLSGGAQDDIGNYSLKLVSSTRSDKQAFALDCFAFDVENLATGASKTATVEIISSGSLNNDDIRVALQYMGTSGNPIASFGDSLATALTASSALPASSSTWNSPPATPQKQLLQLTFTPQRAGRVRGLVRLGKASATVWVNPQIAIT